jgi:hypothetical protein
MDDPFDLNSVNLCNVLLAVFISHVRLPLAKERYLKSERITKWSRWKFHVAHTHPAQKRSNMELCSHHWRSRHFNLCDLRVTEAAKSNFKAWPFSTHLVNSPVPISYSFHLNIAQLLNLSSSSTFKCHFAKYLADLSILHLRSTTTHTKNLQGSLAEKMKGEKSSLESPYAVP